jgi:iron complex transport system substrate-binding protein
VGRPSQAQQLIDRLRTAVQALQSSTNSQTRPKVLWVIQRQPLRVAGTQTFVSELIEIAGGVNAIGPTLHTYPPIGDEDVIAVRPEVIIEPTDQPELRDAQQRSALSFYAVFRTLPAVQNGKIFVIDGDLVSRLGPRIDQGLQIIAACMERE